MMSTTRAPNSVVTAQALFFVNAAVWLAFGVFSLVRLATGTAAQTLVLLVVAILMFGNVGAMLVAGAGIGTRRRPFYYFGAVVLVVNIVLTVTDEFGLFDFITLVIDLMLLGLLIVTRSHYLTGR